MAQNAGGAQLFRRGAGPARIVRTGTEARQGEISMGKGDLLVWGAAFIVVLLIALLVAY